MANDLNRWQGIGRLGQDPEPRHMPNGDAVANFSIACGSKWKDKNTGEPRESTEWVRITAFRKLAEIVGQYLRKGSQVYVEGKLRTRKYEKDGQTHYATEIIADQIQMLGSKPHSEPIKDCPQPETAWKPAASGGGNPAQEAELEDEIPF